MACAWCVPAVPRVASLCVLGVLGVLSACSVRAVRARRAPVLLRCVLASACKAHGHASSGCAASGSSYASNCADRLGAAPPCTFLARHLAWWSLLFCPRFRRRHAATPRAPRRTSRQRRPGRKRPRVLRSRDCGVMVNRFTASCGGSNIGGRRTVAQDHDIRGRRCRALENGELGVPPPERPVKAPTMCVYPLGQRPILALRCDAGSDGSGGAASPNQSCNGNLGTWPCLWPDVAPVGGHGRPFRGRRTPSHPLPFEQVLCVRPNYVNLRHNVRVPHKRTTNSKWLVRQGAVRKCMASLGGPYQSTMRHDQVLLQAHQRPLSGAASMLGSYTLTGQRGIANTCTEVNLPGVLRHGCVLRRRAREDPHRERDVLAWRCAAAAPAPWLPCVTAGEVARHVGGSGPLCPLQHSRRLSLACVWPSVPLRASSLDGDAVDCSFQQRNVSKRLQRRDFEPA